MVIPNCVTLVSLKQRAELTRKHRPTQYVTIVVLLVVLLKIPLPRNKWTNFLGNNARESDLRLNYSDEITV